ncbi:MAG: hypothetical protein HY240_09060 [Actinobacteria bacterium]|nr:hypothetical protein [Actinomycetota bacterium]
MATPSGAIVTTVKTDEDGRFTVRVPAGDYFLSLDADCNRQPQPELRVNARGVQSEVLLVCHMYSGA